MTPAQFLEKNYKWFALAFLALFIIKSIQSCNRGTQLRMSSSDYIEKIDSLEKTLNIQSKYCQDSIRSLNFELRMEREKAESADQRANAVQNAVEKIKSNTTTTVVVKGAEKIDEDNKNKK